MKCKYVFGGQQIDRIVRSKLIKSAYVASVTVCAQRLFTDEDVRGWNSENNEGVIVITKCNSCNTTQIYGVSIDNSGIGDGKVLSFDEGENRIVWVEMSGGGAEIISASLTSANNGATLGVEPSVYMVNIPYGTTSVALPDAASMENRELTFILATPAWEASFEITGLVDGGTYTMGYTGNHRSVKIFSDGTNWYITSVYTG